MGAKFCLQLIVDIFADPDPGSQKLADPNHCFLINAGESDKNEPVTVHYCVETVSYCEHSTPLELFPAKFPKYKHLQNLFSLQSLNEPKLKT